MPSDEALTKFVALSIPWPQAVDSLRVLYGGKKDGLSVDARVSTLTLLEMRSRSLDAGDREKADKDWVAFLNESGLVLGDWALSREFREFLAQGELVGTLQGCGLW